MDLTKEVGETLKKLFPDIKQIRRNELEQGNKPHSFYIRRGRVQSQNQFNNKQMRLYPFVLHYFPEKYPAEEIDQSATRSETMGENLLEKFHYLNDYKAKITNTYYEVHDGVLLFHFQIRLRVTLTTPEPTYMGTLEERSNLVGEQKRRKEKKC